MKKESKNLGITKACPSCKKVIIKDSNFSGTGYFHMKCPHCQTLIKIEVNPKTTLSLKIVILTAIIIVALCFRFLPHKNEVMVDTPQEYQN